MPAYLMTICELTNADDNFKQYAKLSAEAVARHGGSYVLRGKPVADEDGIFGKAFVIMTQYPDAQALAAFRAEELTIRHLREASGTFRSAVFEKD